MATLLYPPLLAGWNHSQACYFRRP